MDKKELFCEYMKYVGLNVCSMIGMSCYILADTFFIANGVGLHGLAALNLAIPVYGIMTAFGIMLGVGTSCRYAIMKGQGNKRDGNIIFSHGLMAAVIIGLLFLALGCLGDGFLTGLVGADAATWELTRTYLQTFLCFSPFFILNSFFSMMVKNDKAPRLAMTAVLCGSFSNIILDYAFIYILHWGMFGAALATGIAPVISLCILTLHRITGKNRFHWTPVRIKLWWLVDIAGLGMPAFISEAAAAVIVILFNTVLLRQAGNLGVAAYGIIANLAIVVTGIFNGIAQGVQPLVGENYGKGEHGKVRALWKYSIITALLVSGLLYALLFSNTDMMIAVFNKERSEELAALAGCGIKIYFIGIFFSGINILSILYYSAIENVKVSFLISALRSGIVIIPLVLILPLLYGTVGIWIAYPVSEAVICGALAASVCFSGRHP